jgi:hypothetical protein
MLPNQNLTEAAAKLLNSKEHIATGYHISHGEDGAIGSGSTFPGPFNILTKDQISELAEKLALMGTATFELT